MIYTNVASAALMTNYAIEKLADIRVSRILLIYEWLIRIPHDTRVLLLLNTT